MLSVALLGVVQGLTEPISVTASATADTSILSAAILGVIQGLTEFLPVSSSGHLEIAKYVMQGGESSGVTGSQSMMMTVVLHFATALSTVLVFRKEVIEIFKGLLAGLKARKWNEDFDFSMKIIISMIPAVIVGLYFEDQLNQLFSGRLMLVGFMLIVTAILLLLADRAKSTGKNVGIVDSVIIGISQAIAVMPGISRSGATISTSVLLGIDREKAAKFSFLMVVPLIFGKMAKDVIDAIKEGEPLAAASEVGPLVVGFIAAFVTGWFACQWMIALVKAARLSYFSIYCFVVAAIAIGWSVMSG